MNPFQRIGIRHQAHPCHATDRCLFQDNIVTRAGASGPAYGIQQNGSDNHFLNNHVTLTGSDGFLISGNRNYVEGNLANNNSGFGFRFGGSGHVYRRNMARGNAGAVCGAGGPCSPDLCVNPAGAATATSAGDNFVPGPPAFPGSDRSARPRAAPRRPGERARRSKDIVRGDLHCEWIRGLRPALDGATTVSDLCARLKPDPSSDKCKQAEAQLVALMP